jgi:hypothetical protein
MAFEEIPDEGPSDFFNFTSVGQNVVGEFVSKRVREGKFGPKNEWTINTGDKTLIITSSYQLTQKLTKAKLNPGDKVDITYTGTMALPGKEHPMQQYRVLVDKCGDTPSEPAKAPQGSSEDVPF